MQFLHACPGKNYTIFSVITVVWGADLGTLQINSKKFGASPRLRTPPLHGTSVAMYIVGQERRLVNPPSQVVAGVRTVTTNMNGRDALPRMSRPFAFLLRLQTSINVFSLNERYPKFMIVVKDKLPRIGV